MEIFAQQTAAVLFRTARLGTVIVGEIEMVRLLNEMNAEDIRLAKEAAAKAEAERKRQEEEAKKRGEAV